MNYNDMNLQVKLNNQSLHALAKNAQNIRW